MCEPTTNRRLVSILQRIAETARRASLTGELNGAGPAAVAQYNKILARVGALDEAAEAIFEPLSSDASMDEVGFAADQLAGWLREGLPKGEEGRGALTRETARLGDKVSISVGDVQLGDLSKLGDMVRQHLPAWLRGEKEEAAEGPGAEAEEEQAAVEAPEATLNELESRLAELGERMSALGLRMERQELPPEETREIAQTLRKLGEEQASRRERSDEESLPAAPKGEIPRSLRSLGMTASARCGCSVKVSAGGVRGTGLP